MGAGGGRGSSRCRVARLISFRQAQALRSQRRGPRRTSPSGVGLLPHGKGSRAIRYQEESVILRLFFESCEVWSGGGECDSTRFRQKEASFYRKNRYPDLWAETSIVSNAFLASRVFPAFALTWASARMASKCGNWLGVCWERAIAFRPGIRARRGFPERGGYALKPPAPSRRSRSSCPCRRLRGRAHQGFAIGKAFFFPRHHSQGCLDLGGAVIAVRFMSDPQSVFV